MCRLGKRYKQKRYVRWTRDNCWNLEEHTQSKETTTKDITMDTSQILSDNSNP
jgi:hypothetical protein